MPEGMGAGTVQTVKSQTLGSLNAMDSVLIKNLLWLVPIIVWFVSKNATPVWRSAIRGASFGAIVSPASMGLYGLYFLGPIVAIFGMLGLILQPQDCFSLG